jgi:putative acetyltransferase
MLIIRKFELRDLDECISLFRNTIHAINAKDYNESQLAAWAPNNIDRDIWEKKFTESIALVAEMNTEIVGFGNITHQGYVDMLYVHKNFQRQGVAKEILGKLESLASDTNSHYFATEASITARPFFESMGYHVLEKQTKEFRGEKFINYVMQKSIK